MTRIHRKVEYALMALKYMAKKCPGERTSAKEISDAFHAPFDATARVLQIMSQKGLLHVEQGMRGGYVIVKDLAKVSFYDLEEMIIGPLSFAKCTQRRDDCELVESCNIQSPIANLNRRLGEFYRSLSLADLLKIKEPSIKPMAGVR
jgi:Rrf2 family protein